jgi:hypothetical protein
MTCYNIISHNQNKSFGNISDVQRRNAFGQHMKLTNYRKDWVRKQVANYAQQIGVSEKDMPTVIFTRKEVLALPKELTVGRRTVTHKCLGICFRRAKTILIHVKKHRSFRELKHTIVHELVHYRFRYLNHGRKFEDRIKLILNNGKRYPLKELYLQTAPMSSLLLEEHDYKQLSFETLISYWKIGFKLVPLDELSKSPTIAWTEIYANPDFWSIEKLKEYSEKFYNISTTFGKTHVKDENGEDLYLHCLDIDSDNVLRM